MIENDFSYIEKEDRPWGRFYVIHNEPNYKIKRIEVNPSSRLSYQYHKGRSETWVIISGNAVATIDDEKINLTQGSTITIPRLSKHRIENRSMDVLIFIEIQTGNYFDEDDIIRIEDDYNRIT